MKTKRVMFSVALVCVLALFSSSLSSCGEPKEKSYYQGRVIEQSIGMPISNVTVYLDGFAYETTSDAQFIFSELEPGRVYNVKVSSPYYEDFAKEIVAVYPSLNEDIKMSLKKTKPDSIPNVRTPETDKLKSFDFDINFGISEKEITIKETGSFVTPDSYSFEMSTKKRDETPAMPGSADTQVQEDKPKFNTAKSIEIGNKQWTDLGEGFKLNEKYHVGFRDIFLIVSQNISFIKSAISNPMFLSDEGDVTLYGHKAKRIKGVTIITENLGKTSEKIFIEFTTAIIGEGEFIGVPVEMEVAAYRSNMQVKTWSKVVLSNFNSSTSINPPLLK